MTHNPHYSADCKCRNCNTVRAQRVEPVKLYETTMEVNAMIAERLEELRTELRAERISYGELAELQDLAEHIDPGDVELLEAAGVPEWCRKCDGSGYIDADEDILCPRCEQQPTQPEQRKARGADTA